MFTLMSLGDQWTRCYRKLCPHPGNEQISIVDTITHHNTQQRDGESVHSLSLCLIELHFRNTRKIVNGESE